MGDKPVCRRAQYGADFKSEEGVAMKPFVFSSATMTKVRAGVGARLCAVGVAALVLTSACDRLPGSKSTAKEEPTTKVAANANPSRGGDGKLPIKENLLAACAKDNIVMGYGKDGDLRTTGSDINGYCEGYLLATYESMILTDAICRDDPQPPTAYFLRSVFQEHAKAAGALSRGDAQAVADAFLDAFSCKRNTN